MQQATRLSRQRLQSVIQANPGIHVRRLAMLVGLSWNCCLYHLRAMEAGGAVSSCKVEGKVCWFDRSAGAFHGKRGTALLRDIENLRVARRVLQAPGGSQRSIAEALRMACSAVHRRVVKMEEAGLLHRLQEGRCMQVFPSPDLPELLRQSCLDGSTGARLVEPDGTRPADPARQITTVG